MKVFSFGCSLIFGDELEDTYPSFSKLTWPALWAKSHNFTYECFAKNGISNWAISRIIIDTITTNQPDFAIVQWSYPNRIEIRNNEDQYKALSIWQNIEDPAVQIRATRHYRLAAWPKDKPLNEFESNELCLENELKEQSTKFESKFANLWYKNISSIETDLYFSLIWMNLASFWLNHLKIPHVFAAADNDLNVNINDPLILTLLKTIQQNSPWVGWKNSLGYGFVPWAKENNYSFGISHPLSIAHKDAFYIAKPYIDKCLTY